MWVKALKPPRLCGVINMPSPLKNVCHMLIFWVPHCRICVGKYTVAAVKDINYERLVNAFRYTTELKKKARQMKIQAKRRLEVEEEDADDSSYGAGMF